MINVALVDPQQLYRSSFALIINSLEGFCVVCEAASGEALLQYIVQSGPPDVVLLNLKQNGMTGYALAAWLHGNHPRIKILVISMYNNEVQIARFLRTGIRAFLKMEVGREELQKALQQVAEDDGFYVGGNDGKMLEVLQFGNKAARDKLLLSDEEIFFIRFLFGPDSMDEIAGKMGMCRRTAYNYMEALCKKLEVKTRVGIAVWAERNGVLHW